jgi:hypothetical protein
MIGRITGIAQNLNPASLVGSNIFFSYFCKKITYGP